MRITVKEIQHVPPTDDGPSPFGEKFIYHDDVVLSTRIFDVTSDDISDASIKVALKALMSPSQIIETN